MAVFCNKSKTGELEVVCPTKGFLMPENARFSFEDTKALKRLFLNGDALNAAMQNICRSNRKSQ